MSHIKILNCLALRTRFGPRGLSFFLVFGGRVREIGARVMARVRGIRGTGKEKRIERIKRVEVEGNWEN